MMIPTFAVALVLSWLVVATLVRRSALLDQPNERSMHSVPTPRGGGLPIALAAAVGLAVVPDDRLAGLAQGALVALVAVVGMVDDARGLSARTRMVVHLGAAAGAIALWGAPRHLQLGGVDLVLPAALAVALTVVWIVGLLNAWNFMDGIDGIAGGAALTAATSWGAAAALAGADALLVGLAAIAGASVGFLAWNWRPARIFMGDVASTALGYTFAVLPLLAPDVAPPARTPWLALGAVFPFVYDAASTFVRRALRRENVFAAHRTHAYQLLALKIGHPRVSAGYAALSLLTGGVGVAFAAGWVGEAAAWASLGLVVAAVEAARGYGRVA